MDIIALLPPLPKVAGLRWQKEEANSSGFPHCARISLFQNLRLESAIAQPIGKICRIEIKHCRGKYPKTRETYNSNVRLRILAIESQPTHEIEWIYDSAKYMLLPECGRESAVFADQANGWLLFAIRPLNQTGQLKQQTTKTPESQPTKPTTTGRLKPESPKTTPKSKLPTPAPQKPRSFGAWQSQSLNASDASAAVNEGLDNQRRADKSAEIIQEAVANLKSSHNWDQLGTKQKISLLKAEVKELRGTSISNQTLYREWVYPLWN